MKAPLNTQSEGDFDPSDFFRTMTARFKERVLRNGMCCATGARSLRPNARGLLNPDMICSDVIQCAARARKGKLPVTEAISYLILWWRHSSDLIFWKNQARPIERQIALSLKSVLEIVRTDEQIRLIHYFWVRENNDPVLIVRMLLEEFLCRFAARHMTSSMGKAVRKIMGQGYSQHSRERLGQIARGWRNRIKTCLKVRNDPPVIRFLRMVPYDYAARRLLPTGTSD